MLLTVRETAERPAIAPIATPDVGRHHPACDRATGVDLASLRVSRPT
jgi:hypothetical protein